MGAPVGAFAAAAALIAAPSACADFGIVPGTFFSGTCDTPANGVSCAPSDTPDTQAGSHPYAMTTSFALNQTTNFAGERVSDGSVRDIHVQLPPGLIGNPNVAARCTQQELVDASFAHPPACPNGAAIGLVALNIVGSGEFTFPVYDMEPAPGVPDEFGFNVLGVMPTYITAAVRTGSDYGITVSLADVSQALPLIDSSLTFWGVPADPSHDPLRGSCLNFDGSSAGSCPSGMAPKPFLTLPTACAGPQATTLEVDSWENPADPMTASFTGHDVSGNPVGMSGCGKLPFSPSINVQPDSTTADAPAGLAVDLAIPQNDNPTGLAEANLKKAVIVLPPGVVISPAAADGLEACTLEEIGLGNGNTPNCPAASKVGAVEIDIPLLRQPLDGSVYLAQQDANPFGSLLALYLTAEAEGVLIKLAGHVSLNPVTGQLTTTFDENPQLPVSELKLSFFGGPRAALANPTSCGTYTGTAQLTPYSSSTPVTPSSWFNIDQGCASPPPFAPGFSAGMIDNQAGGFSPFSMTLSRSDADQDLSGLSVRMPTGLLGLVSKVSLCPEPQASLGRCGPESLIGHTTTAAGPGSHPFWVTGNVYLTDPYRGAPFGLSIVVHAKAGPLDLGNVIVRTRVNVDPRTSQLVITSDPLPTILDGIPLQLKTVKVTMDREGFMFNPTNCKPLSVEGTITSTQGPAAKVSSPFQASNCATLPFTPRFTASTQARTSRTGGASLHVKITSGTGQANIASTAVTLPKVLPARLTTLQKACREAVFNANPASCPAASVIGRTTAVTPVLAVPLTGPVLLVSHGGAAFPDVVIVLQGDGVTVDLEGGTLINKRITSVTFASVPDAPITSFDLVLPEGPHSVLSAERNLCRGALTMPTTIAGQNGAKVKQQTKIAVSGCPAKRRATKAGKAGSARRK